MKKNFFFLNNCVIRLKIFLDLPVLIRNFVITQTLPAIKETIVDDLCPNDEIHPSCDKKNYVHKLNQSQMCVSHFHSSEKCL